jgi:glutamate mutase epsilon subunit
MGNGDIVLGCIEGVEAGILDAPFCPNVNVKDKVLGVRDVIVACSYAAGGITSISNPCH